MASKKKTAEIAPVKEAPQEENIVARQTSATTSKSIAKMTVSFGLVQFPVKLFKTTDDHSISFHQVNAEGERVRYMRHVDGTEIPFEDIEKGYELPDGSMVILTKDDMSALSEFIDSTKAIAVEKFIDAATLNPLALSGSSYYLAPDKVANTAYVILRDAMANTGRAAVAKVTLRNRETVAVVRPYGETLILTMLNWDDEIRVPAFTRDITAQPSALETNMAEQLIEALSGDFDLADYEDHYTNALAAIVTAKMKGAALPAPAEMPAIAAQPNMADALRASLKAVETQKEAS